MDIIVDGRYQIVKRIGKGGFAHTYLAKNLTAPGEPQCVLKQLRPRVEHPRVLDLFRQEAAMLSRFDRPQIPKAIEYFEHQGDFYLVQDFIAGDDLRQEFTIGHQWSEAKVIQFLVEMLDVLGYIHDRQAIHRDIKPANIIRRWDSGELCAIDFGAVLDLSNEPLMLTDLDDDLSPLLELDEPATSLDPNLMVMLLDLDDESPTAIQTRASANETIVGTPGYQAPEQKNGNATFGSDIYALGMTAIQFLTGQYPLHLVRNEAKELVWRDSATISDRLASILDRMTQFELADRYQSTALVLEDLHPLITELEDPTSTTEVDPPIDRRFNQKALAVLMALSLGSIGVGVAIGTTELSPTKVTIEAKIHSPIRSIV